MKYQNSRDSAWRTITKFVWQLGRYKPSLPVSWNTWHFHIYCCKNCNVCFKRSKINDKRGRGMPILKNPSMCQTHVIRKTSSELISSQTWSLCTRWQIRNKLSCFRAQFKSRTNFLGSYLCDKHLVSVATNWSGESVKTLNFATTRWLAGLLALVP